MPQFAEGLELSLPCFWGCFHPVFPGDGLPFQRFDGHDPPGSDLRKRLIYP
jgi:hypothetical protein